jgi:general secretion pathway protein M
MLQSGSVLSRTLAVVLLGIALLGGYQLIFAPVLVAYRDGETSIEQSKELLERYQALAEQRSLLADRLAEQQERAASAAGYLTGPSDALAAAQLQDRVKSVVEAAGGELRSTQILPATRLEGNLGFRRTTLRVQFVVTIQGLETTLYELETGQPYLIIDDVTVRQERIRRSRRDDPKSEPVLNVSFELFGYLREEPA